MGISTWLVPPSPQSETLQSVIEHTAKRYSFVSFAPHVTLFTVPQTSIPGTASSLRDTILPPSNVLLRILQAHSPRPESAPEGVPVHFTGVDSTSAFFKSGLVNVELTDLLSHLYDETVDWCTSQGCELDEKVLTAQYDPHMSLFYGGSSVEEKETIMDHMLEDGTVVEKDGSDGQSVAVSGIRGFTASEIWIVDCTGPVEGWKVLDKVALS